MASSPNRAYLPRSSNGRTAAFGAVNRGSNPCRGATLGELNASPRQKEQNRVTAIVDFSYRSCHMQQTTSDHEFLHGRGDLGSAAEAIRSMKWGADESSPHPVLSVNDLKGVLKRALTGEASLSVIREWADAIEG